MRWQTMPAKASPLENQKLTPHLERVFGQICFSFPFDHPTVQKATSSFGFGYHKADFMGQ
jgi:hypothetical protein